jgi:hypothetical protein
VDARQAAMALREWVAEVPFAGPELLATGDALQFAWAPRWLVEQDVRAVLEVHLAFEEPVGTSLEGWVRGRWSRREPPRTRWETRVGRVERRYPDLLVPAFVPAPVADADRLDESVAATPDAWSDPWLLPSRAPEEQVPAALSALRAAVVADAVRAAGATRAEDLHLTLSPSSSAPEWTLQLVPMWIGRYRDNDGVVRVLTVNAVTGRCAGVRSSSRAVAAAYAGRQTATGLAVALFAAFLALVGVIFWLLLPVSAAVGLLGLWLVLSARSAGPAVVAWNRSEG